MKSIPLCLLLLLTACGSVGPIANIEDANVDDVARSAGMSSLAATPLPEGRREIRLWLSQGLLLPDQMVRLSYAHDRWLGELWRYWPRNEADHGIYGWSHEALGEIMERCGCARTIRGPEYAVCRVIEERALDWESVALRLKQLDIAGLSEAPVPPGAATRGAADGDGLEVEVRAGAAYHRVRYDRFDDSEPARRAGQIMRMIKDLDPSVACDRN